MNIESDWQDFDVWISRNCSDVIGLNPGATDISISKAESVLGVTFPECVRRFYLMHDGQDPDSPGIFDGYEFLSLEGVVDGWRLWKDLLDSDEFEDYQSTPAYGIRADWWNTGWIPFTHNGCGDHHCVDMQPDAGGDVGQIITMWHAEDTRSKVADSLESWFSNYVKGVLAGKYVYSEDDFGIVDKEYLS